MKNMTKKQNLFKTLVAWCLTLILFIVGFLSTHNSVIATQKAYESITGVDLAADKNNDTFILYPVTLDQTKVKEPFLQAVKKVRSDLYDKNPWINLEDPYTLKPIKPNKRLQTLVKEAGFTTKEEYVNNIAWDLNAEKMAVQRAVEVLALQQIQHKRPSTNTDIFTMKIQETVAGSEVLAQGSSSHPFTVDEKTAETFVKFSVDGWASEEGNLPTEEYGNTRDIVKDVGKPGETGHLIFLIEPKNKYYGFSYVLSADKTEIFSAGISVGQSRSSESSKLDGEFKIGIAVSKENMNNENLKAKFEKLKEETEKELQNIQTPNETQPKPESETTNQDESEAVKKFKEKYSEIINKTAASVTVEDKLKLEEAINEHNKLNYEDQAAYDVEHLTKLHKKVLELEAEQEQNNKQNGKVEDVEKPDGPQGSETTPIPPANKPDAKKQENDDSTSKPPVDLPSMPESTNPTEQENPRKIEKDNGSSTPSEEGSAPSDKEETAPESEKPSETAPSSPSVNTEKPQTETNTENKNEGVPAEKPGNSTTPEVKPTPAPEMNNQVGDSSKEKKEETQPLAHKETNVAILNKQYTNDQYQLEVNKVSNITKANQLKKNENIVLDDNHELEVFDIKLKHNDKYITTFEDGLEIFIPTNKKAIKAVYIKDNKIEEEYKVTKVDNGYTFKTNHLSLYGLVYDNSKPKQTVTHNPNWQQDLRKHNEFISKHNKETNKTLPNTGHINNHSILLASTLLTLVAYKLYKKED